jgi:hypothetical protein
MSDADKTERMRRAIDQQAERERQHFKQGGREVTHEERRREIVKIMETAERREKENSR